MDSHLMTSTSEFQDSFLVHLTADRIPEGREKPALQIIWQREPINCPFGQWKNPFSMFSFSDR